MKPNEAPIGEWQLAFSLRNMFEPNRVHATEEVRAIFLTSVLMRQQRNESYFARNTTRISADADLCRIRGISAFNRETSIKILDELALCIGAQCGQKIVEIFIPRLNPPNGTFRRLYKVTRTKP